MSLDIKATLAGLKACGLTCKGELPDLILKGGTLKAPQGDLECGNSGTTARLFAGFFAGLGLPAKLIGDRSLSRRPMQRVVEPLRMMGAQIKSSTGTLPMSLEQAPLMGIDYQLELPSAQVKSALLLAAVGAEGETIIHDPFKTRDHTERMFRFLGIELKTQGETISLKGPLSQPLDGFELKIPADPSTAAYFMAAAALLPGSELILKNLLLNPTRNGFFKVLERMGAEIEILDRSISGAEEIGDLKIRFSRLQAIELEPFEPVTAIDEIPILAVLATQAEGTTILNSLSELRLKECDRIAAILINLTRMGADIIERGDDLIITGPTPLSGTEITTFSDHRIAMAFSIAALIAKGATPLDDPHCVAVSFPDFHQVLKSLLL